MVPFADAEQMQPTYNVPRGIAERVFDRLHHVLGADVSRAALGTDAGAGVTESRPKPGCEFFTAPMIVVDSGSGLRRWARGCEDRVDG